MVITNSCQYEGFFEYVKKYHSEFLNDSSDLSGLSLSELWKALAEQLHETSSSLAQIIGGHLQLKVMENIEDIDKDYLSKIPHKFALTNLVIPILSDKESVVFVTSNPFNKELEAQLKFSVSKNVEIRVAPPEQIELHIARFYSESFRTKLQPLGKLWLDKDGQLLNIGTVESREIPTLARQILVKAMYQNASDLHLQPLSGTYVVRFRVDGVLHRVLALPYLVAEDIIRYFKSKSGMDPTNEMITQDGQMTVSLDNRNFNLRLSLLPVKDGQRLVIRFLDQGRVYSINGLGLSLHDLHALQGFVSESSGLVLVTGPTGSGKTTTLYTLLSEINREDISIITVENPVEYEIPGISQTQVNFKTGLTFAEALRSILRQDPEVILIGEIRDKETAKIAMQAALTGHLVLATLHTNDAITCIPRMLDLGVSSAVLADAFKGVVSQRLLRKLCVKCRVPVEEPLSFEESLFFRTTHVKPSFRAKGCLNCKFTGFSGRAPILEVFENNHELAQLISTGQKDISSLRNAVGNNMMPISVAASKQIISGETTVFEAARILGFKFWSECAEYYQGDAPSSVEVNSLWKNNVKSQLGVLIISDNLENHMYHQLSNAWFDIFNAQSPEEAHKMLKEHSDIALVILELPVDLNDKQQVKLVEQYRVAMAWSQLPAIVLIPQGREKLAELLKTSGTTSLCLSLPISGIELSQQVIAQL
ncbi:ATPase, T2SS/T4P/T4SS family [Pleionea sediminis]|uniref:ATPase, T2SS/T4P/T4SS family n=1 Tax=Pleionea sediminis TaxID=2569479 RepID=UPI001186CBD6|nr:ATPase, T2SS/T4P/T4SS family [Pleionea sediminis]